MSEFHTKRVAEIIQKIMYVTIATVCEDGSPWNSPVYSAFDADLNFYWFSDKDSQHSRNIRATGEAFIVVYDSTVPEGTGEGAYLQVNVHELMDETEVMAAKTVCDERVGKEKDRDYSKYSGDAPLRGYKASPVKVWMNDDAKNPDGSYLKDVRVEIPIDVILFRLSLPN